MLVGLLAVSFVLGCIGFARVESRPLVDLIYASAQLVVFQAGSVPSSGIPWELELARFAAPVFAALLGIGGLIALVRRHEWRAARMRGHTIVCGVGRGGSALATAFQAQGEPVVGISKDDASPEVVRCRSRGIPVRIGDAADPDVLAWAGVDRAKRVIAASGDDSVNAEVAVALRALRGEGESLPDDLLAWIHIVDPELEQLLQPMLDPWIRTFNLYRDGAEALRQEHLLPALRGRTGARLLIVGLGKLGRSVALEARREPAVAEVIGVDRDARAKIEELLVREPPGPTDAPLTAIDLDVTAADFEIGRFLGPEGVACALVCLDNESLALATGLTLLRRLGPEVPIVIRVSGLRPSLADLIDSDNDNDRYRNVRAFRLLERACAPAYFGDRHGQRQGAARRRATDARGARVQA